MTEAKKLINDVRSGQSSCAGMTDQRFEGGWGGVVDVVVVFVVETPTGGHHHSWPETKAFGYSEIVSYGS